MPNPFVGMSLMYGCELVMAIVDGADSTGYEHCLPRELGGNARRQELGFTAIGLTSAAPDHPAAPWVQIRQLTWRPRQVSLVVIPRRTTYARPAFCGCPSRWPS